MEEQFRVKEQVTELLLGLGVTQDEMMDLGQERDGKRGAEEELGREGKRSKRNNED